MKRVKSLSESRTQIRDMFRTAVQEMFNKAIKELTAEELIASIRKVAESVTIVYIPEGLNEFTTLKHAFKEEITILGKVSAEMKANPELIWKTPAEIMAPETAPEAEAAPVEEVKPEPEKPKGSNRKIGYIGMDGEQVDLNKIRVGGKVYVAGKLDQVRQDFIKQGATGLKWEEWVDANFHEFKGEVPGAAPEKKNKRSAEPKKAEAEKGTAPDPEKAIPVMLDDRANSDAVEFFTRKLTECKTEDDLKLVVDFMNSEAESTTVMVKNSDGQKGVVTGTGTNKAKGNRPFMVITLADGSVSRPFSEIFARFFKVAEDASAHKTIMAEATKK